MDCDWVTLLLMDYLDGSCIDPLREKIEGHLARCGRCRAERDALASIDGALAGASVPEPPAGMTDAAVQSVLRPAAPASRGRDLRRLAAAAAVLLAAGGAFQALDPAARLRLPDSRAVREWTDSVERTGESLTASLVDVTRDLLHLPDGHSVE